MTYIELLVILFVVFSCSFISGITFYLVGIEHGAKLHAQEVANDINQTKTTMGGKKV